VWLMRVPPPTPTAAAAGGGGRVGDGVPLPLPPPPPAAAEAVGGAREALSVEQGQCVGEGVAQGVVESEGVV
jgi:hypothetical protein